MAGQSEVRHGFLRAFAAVLAGSALALAGCVRAGTNTEVTEGGNAGDLSLAPCTVTIAGATRQAECGTLLVAEAADTTDSSLIALPVMRIATTADLALEPVFRLGGGPGASNMGYRPRPELLAAHDVVLIGYRGVDGSRVLECPEMERAVRGQGADLLSAESLAGMRRAFAECETRLQADDIDLGNYTMLDVIRDMEAAREALGYERINLLSESYGTRIAQLYAYQHPERLYRSVLVAPNPPGRFVWEPDVTDRQLEHYARLCAEDAECSARTQDLAETMRSVAQNMPRRWFFLPIDPGKVRVASFMLLFHRDSAALIFDAYLAAERGDASGLALLSLAYDFVVPSIFVWGDMAVKATSADCDPTRDYLADMDPPGSILGAPFSRLLWGGTDCQAVELIPEEFRLAQPSEVETLLLVGSIDFSTPAEHTVNQLLPTLASGTLLLLEEAGHTDDLNSLHGSATARALAGFYRTGEVDDASFDYVPMQFSVSWGLPKLAKLAVFAVLLLIAGLAGLTWFLLRVRRRRLKARAGAA